MASEAIETSRKAAGLQFPLKDKQIETLSAALTGQDVLAALPTGYGKSITFALLPTAWDTLNGHNPGTSIVIVISPLERGLMEQQLNKLNALGIPAVHLGSPENSPETISKVTKGQFSLVLLRPEEVCTAQWREVLASPLYRSRVKTICVDEAHCSVVGSAQFRTDYARILELRSILPGANMLALTASAPPPMRLTIAKLLGMRASHLKVIEGSVDRPNIMFTGVRSSSIKHTLYWIADELREHQQHCPKYIIYCRNVNDVARIYRYLHDELGSDGYIGIEAVRTRLFGMFHRSTKHRVKKYVLDTFPTPESSIRVVICTIDLCMGINVPDVKAVVHWGAAKTFEGFFQQCGRAGRDSQIVEHAYSIVYYQDPTVSGVPCDDTMWTYCNNEEEMCRREMILEHFSTTHEPPFAGQQHNCCDVCHSQCKCGHCPPLPGKPPREMTDSDREEEEEYAREFVEGDF